MITSLRAKKASPFFRYYYVIMTILALLFTQLTAIASKQNIRHQISRVTHSLNKDQTRQHYLLSTLKKTELKSGQLQLQIKQLQTQLKSQSFSIKQLQQKQQLFQNQLKRQIESLKLNLSTLYILEKQPAIKLLLDHKTDNKTSRMLVYYQYLNQAKIQDVQQIRSILKKLQINKLALSKKLQHLSVIKDKNQQQQLDLKKKHKTRQQLLQQINLRIKGRQALLSSLNQRRQQLDTTVKSLSQTQSRPMNSSFFASTKGHLPWPTIGKVITRFGQPILRSQLRQAGILIKASAGQPVKAIAKGKVIFAKWLLGYGQLLIISHDNGYMTLYGRNRNIFKKVGDTVKAGDIIATVGNTGGNQTTALYFAIRHNATALNPLGWCEKITT